MHSRIHVVLFSVAIYAEDQRQHGELSREEHARRSTLIPSKTSFAEYSGSTGDGYTRSRRSVYHEQSLLPTKLKVDIRTRNIGCFSANFSTPPLMMLVCSVMIPACRTECEPFLMRGQHLTVPYHLNGTAERHLHPRSASLHAEHTIVGLTSPYIDGSY